MQSGSFDQKCKHRIPDFNSRFFHLYFLCVSLLVVQLGSKTSEFLGLVSALMSHAALLLTSEGYTQLHYHGDMTQLHYHGDMTKLHYHGDMTLKICYHNNKTSHMAMVIN